MAKVFPVDHPVYSLPACGPARRPVRCRAGRRIGGRGGRRPNGAASRGLRPSAHLRVPFYLHREYKKRSGCQRGFVRVGRRTGTVHRRPAQPGDQQRAGGHALIEIYRRSIRAANRREPWRSGYPDCVDGQPHFIQSVCRHGRSEERQISGGVHGVNLLLLGVLWTAVA